MPSSFYSYRLENPDDSKGESYTFYSPKNKRLYSVDFDIDLYADSLVNYPVLSGNSYALAFAHVETQRGYKPTHDAMVRQTIIRIIRDFIAAKGSECILIYHCDVNDRRQRCRHQLFNKWYIGEELNQMFIKEAVEVDLPIGEAVQKYYLGYLTANNNPNIESIREEFDAFSISMISL